MPSRPSKTTRELLALFRRAGRGEYNLAAFLRERPTLATHLGVTDLEQDDAELTLQLGSMIVQYKERVTHGQAGERALRASAAARTIAASARRRSDLVELDAAASLGDLLADGSKKYIFFELPTLRVSILRSVLLRARGALRSITGVTAAVDEGGLHLGWGGGRGGLNLRSQREEPGATAVTVDLREVRRCSRASAGPVLLAEVLADLGFM